MDFEQWWDGPGGQEFLRVSYTRNLHDASQVAYTAGLRRAAEIANEPYSNEVQATGINEPSEVGLKISEAIEREASKIEREGV